SLAARFGVREQVSLQRTLVDPKLQWSRVGNFWHNAGGVRSVIYMIAAPVLRGVRGLMRRRRK
ncbi:MAG: hypothetical protein M3341_07855, partial [Actinomycetota bacterium]|nr:hypothetical protein [Actinomycetota bacterium]